MNFIGIFKHIKILVIIVKYRVLSKDQLCLKLRLMAKKNEAANASSLAYLERKKFISIRRIESGVEYRATAIGIELIELLHKTVEGID